jgi:D-alanyl-lipoteichoic acid acyltransferase DltB (MBOAT superfamily)
VFKYYNFFVSSFAEFLNVFDYKVNPYTLDIILPVGISFYTFHGISYIVDIYNRRIKSENNFIDYAVFVSFFPLLVAGPIERATHLLPQIKKGRIFDYTHATNGLRQILWGLFKKIVIADSCAYYVNEIFSNSENYNGSTLVLGAVLFAIQIYCDFSGYSDIAIGTARLFGIELLRNFAFPYFSRDIAEFWRRWHISLSSWFRDYVYIPLGGSKGSLQNKIRNTMIIFLLSGLWHGANWTFIFWGALNALYFLPLLLLKTNRNALDVVAQGKYLPSLRDAVKMGLTFSLTLIAWIFFRSESLGHAFQYIRGVFSTSFFSIPDFPGAHKAVILALFILLLFSIEWIGREGHYALAKFNAVASRPTRWMFYYFIILIIFVWGGEQQQFIYFQF